MIRDVFGESVSPTIYFLYLLLALVFNTHVITWEINEELGAYCIFITLLLLLTTNWFTPGVSVLQFKTGKHNTISTTQYIKIQ